MRVRLKMGKSPSPDVKTTCASCQSAIPADARFCASCHSPVVRRYCPKCSRLVPEHTKLCPYCGASSKLKPRDTSLLSNVAVLALIGLAAAFFLMGGLRPFQSESKKVEPAPEVQLADQPVAQAGSVRNAQSSGTVHAAGRQQRMEPIVRSDEEGTRLNLEAYELIQQKKYAEAEPILRRAVQSFPAGTTAVAYKYALYNLGHVLRRTDRAKEAIPFLEQCVKIDPAWTKAQAELANARSQAQPS